MEAANTDIYVAAAEPELTAISRMCSRPIPAVCETKTLGREFNLMLKRERESNQEAR